MRHGLLSFLSTTFDGIAQVDEEIRKIATLLVDAAKKTLPRACRRKRMSYTDRTLQQLCSQSREARASWITVGRPPKGPLYEEKLRLRRAPGTCPSHAYYPYIPTCKQ